MDAFSPLAMTALSIIGLVMGSSAHWKLRDVEATDMGWNPPKPAPHWLNTWAEQARDVDRLNEFRAIAPIHPRVPVAIDCAGCGAPTERGRSDCGWCHRRYPGDAAAIRPFLVQSSAPLTDRQCDELRREWAKSHTNPSGSR